MDRPKSVILAIKLLCFSLAFGLAVNLLAPSGIFHKYHFGQVIGNVVAMIAITAFFCYKFWTRRNWARVLLLILSIWGILSEIFLEQSAFKQVDVISLTNAVQWVASFYALYLLYTKESSAWFAKRDLPPQNVESL